MAVENLGKVITLIAGVDLSGSQYCFVAIDGSGNAILAGDDWPPDGVLQNNPTLGNAAEVMVGAGITKYKAGAATTLGQWLTTGDSSGRGYDASTGDYILGKTVGAATAANEIGSMLFRSGPAKL